MKLLFYFQLSLLFSGTISRAQSGCVASATDSGSPRGFVCEDQIVGPFIGQKYKIEFNYTDLLNIHTISTVGETDEDTELYLYDTVTNNILAYNDDASDCEGCTQSTITYSESISSARQVYVIVAKKGCNVLTLPTGLKFSARNAFNTDPKILSPISVIQCIGNTVQFTYDPSTTSNPSPWLSLTPSIVTIDATTGFARFLTNGIAKIQLKGNLSCNIQNNYIVKGSLTSTITPK